MASEKLQFRRRHEIVIGLVGAVGTDLPAVERGLELALREVGYKVKIFKVSEQLKEIFGTPPNNSNCEYDRINHLMNCGDHLRERTENGEAVALLGIGQIRRLREGRQDHRGASHTKTDGANVPASEVAYVLHSLKHPMEVELLRGVYGHSFFAVFATRLEKRV
jgi:hypothetical protein